MANISTHPITHVKMDAKGFNDIIVGKVRKFSPDQGVTTQDWERAANALSKIFNENPNVILFQETFEVLKADACYQLDEVFQDSDKLNAILSRVLSSYKHIFEEIAVQQPDREKFKQILPLYRKLLEEMEPNSLYQRKFLYNWFSNEQPPPFDFRDIDIELNLHTIHRIFNESHVIQLRPINPDAKVLIIGCGNGRFSNDGNSSIEYSQPDQAQYSLDHNHPRNVVTVDADFTANPTIVAMITRPFAQVFRSHKFDQIILEGFQPKPVILQHLLNDLKSVLTPNGTISIRA